MLLRAPPRRAHGTVHSAASRSLIRHRAQFWSRWTDSVRIFTFYEPCARDWRCAEIDARFPSKPVCLRDSRGFQGSIRGPELTERRSHVAAEPTRPRPLQRSGKIRRTADSRVSASRLLRIRVYRAFTRELELNELNNQRLINRLLIIFPSHIHSILVYKWWLLLLTSLASPLVIVVVVNQCISVQEGGQWEWTSQ